jgi:type 1 glutamine amidotransferase
MRRRCGYIMIITVLLLSSIRTAMAQNRNSLTINNDRLTLQLDLQSSQKELDSILSIAGLNAPNAKQIIQGDYSALDKDGWTKVSSENNIVRFDRPLSELNNNPQSSPFIISLQIPQLDGKPGYPAEVKYGVNGFLKTTVLNLSSGLTRFILPGNMHARRVFLSGNFNSWSTLKGAMKKMDGGWMLDIKLEPGIYQYKYIIGGRWSTDPNNLLEANDGAGNINSVFYKYNYTFKLKGYISAHKVIVAGDFNKWDTDELEMTKNGNTWEKQMYLSDGKHEYRFWVDGKWVDAKGNPIKEKDDAGNSLLNLGETVYFKLYGYSSAKKVLVAGDFNAWKPGELNLKKVQGVWTLPMVLSAGNYDYKFIVDGTWITDPLNSNYAVEKGVTNSFLAVKPNHTFKLKGYNSANKIKLSGTFNNWNPDGYILSHKGGEWAISLYLKPGKYLYKFIVDGEWIRDPGNKYWEENDNNSVLWME